VKLRALLLTAVFALTATTAVAGPHGQRNGEDSESANAPRRGAAERGPADRRISEDDEDIVYFEPDDPDMNRAIAQARETLPSFWRLFSTDRDVAETASLKMAFPVPGTKDGNEYMWLIDIRRDGRTIKGVLDNQPESIRNLKKGDTVTIDPERISDWSYVRDGRMYGSYTTRVMLKHLSEQEAEEYLEFLSVRPLEGPDT
jgi:uncharacterized protein YegJ (DUF2314 family)